MKKFSEQFIYLYITICTFQIFLNFHLKKIAKKIKSCEIEIINQKVFKNAYFYPTL
jgi:hypothetical protein